MQSPQPSGAREKSYINDFVDNDRMVSGEQLTRIEEYKTLRDEILKCYEWILNVQLGVFASTSLIFAYLLTEEDVNEYTFFVPLSAIIPAYFINQDLLYTIYRISAYVNVHLSEFKWEARIQKLRNDNFKNQLLVLERFTYFDINSLFYVSIGCTCAVLFLVVGRFYYYKLLISFAVMFVLYKLLKVVDFHEKRNDMIEEWRKIS